MKRYFILFYYGKSKYGDCRGNTTYITDGSFINSKEITEYLKEQMKMYEVVLTNIIELSEKDFKDYTALQT